MCILMYAWLGQGRRSDLFDVLLANDRRQRVAACHATGDLGIKADRAIAAGLAGADF